MQALTLTASLFGVEALPVNVEADVSGGLPRFAIVGLPDSAVREATERVRAAVKRSGFDWPDGRITVNLAPADLRKGGAGLDLPIALAVLGATGKALKPLAVRGCAFHGELSLSGRIHPAPGALAVADAVQRAGADRLFTAAEAAPEAALVGDLAVHSARSLQELVAQLSRGEPQERVAPAASGPVAGNGPELADVLGQSRARRALEVAAAGFHPILFYGPPGSGKTMLARRLPGLLPPPGPDELLEITRIASCAGRAGDGTLLTRRPFRAPHHTVTGRALVGGGVPPRPGELTLAHRGVLFLDELSEFRRPNLELLRQPLEEGSVVLVRGGRRVIFPCRVLLAAAMNPCPCGFRGDPRRDCTCTPGSVDRYRARLSGPLLDRLGLQVEVPALRPEEMEVAAGGENTAQVRVRVAAAWERQAARFRGTAWHSNGDLDGAGVRRLLQVEPAARDLLSRSMDRLALSARARDHVLKVAQTVADLAGQPTVGTAHVAEAVGYRTLDRPPSGTAETLC